ncbi:MAG: D-2-hydroxyacid dehydrogenase [Ilumatobacteraceae bacterium]
MRVRPGDTLAVDDVARIEIAWFSADLFPQHSGPFLRVALDAPNLRWMHVFNAGVDHPVFARFTARGVRLTTSAGASAIPIAHTVMMHLLAMCRGVRTYETNQRGRIWQSIANVDMEGRTLAVIGLGAIGSEVARLAARFGMSVIGLRRTPAPDDPCETWAPGRLPELLAVADDVVLAAPLTDATHHIIGVAELAMMRAGVHMVNIGRGELVDEPALIAALRSGHVGAAALDVFAAEPLPVDSPLWDMPNVTVTPHAAGGTELSHRRAADMFVENLRNFWRGAPLRNEVF